MDACFHLGGSAAELLAKERGAADCGEYRQAAGISEKPQAEKP
jgi:hypothetical protein